MSSISLSVTRFNPPYNNLNSITHLNVVPTDVVRSIITVGAQQASNLTAFGLQSIYKNIALSFMALSVLDFSQTRLVRSPLFDSLDGSEKANFSYWLGMCFAKLFSERHLNVQWLAHADPYIKSRIATIQNGSRSRADLLGLDTANNWHVFEAKGRSRNANQAAKDLAKDQARRIVSINGNPPETNCASFLCLKRNTTSGIVIDPPPRKQDKTSIVIDSKMLLRVYYTPLIDYLGSSQSRVENKGGLDFRMAPLFSLGNGHSDMSIGLLEDIFQVQYTSMDLMKRYKSALRKLNSVNLNVTQANRTPLQTQSVGLDGIIVEGTYNI